jgi:hypothetical protein
MSMIAVRVSEMVSPEKSGAGIQFAYVVGTDLSEIE